MKCSNEHRLKAIVFLLGLLFCNIASVVKAQVTLPKLVRDSMILQRDGPVNIWGWASPGEKITISFAGKKYRTITKADRSWKIAFPPTPAGGPYTMNIDASNHITLSNILMGDVWLCSGQSNMDMEKLNTAFKQMMIKNDPAMKEIFDHYPAYTPLTRVGGPNLFAPPSAADLSPTEQLLAAGWGYVTIDPGSIQADNGAGITHGIIGLVNKGQPRKPDDWGVLRAWAWGAAKGMDYLETEPLVDAKKVGIEGVSRYGKAALVTMAFEPRFALGLIGSSGKGGTTLHRRVFGEAVESLTGGGYYWMAGNYMKYGAAEAASGSKTGCDLPVDSHELIAMAAPRPLFISYGIPEKGDAHWLDQHGSYMATVAAGPVYKLLGAKDLGVSNDYKSEKMPPVLTGLLDGQLAWRQHDGGHTDAPNFKYFIPWASTMVNYVVPKP